jgi:hypothetical protein
MRAHQAFEKNNTLPGLLTIGELLRAEYNLDDAPLPERLGTLLEQLEPTVWPTSAAESSQARPSCPRCKLELVQVVHVQAFGGHPALGAYECPRCRYIAG